VKILRRADFGFAREALILWCEHNLFDYIFDPARNARLEASIVDALAETRRRSETEDGAPALVFRERGR
jgi:hypothetical protein